MITRPKAYDIYLNIYIYIIYHIKQNIFFYDITLFFVCVRGVI